MKTFASIVVGLVFLLIRAVLGIPRALLRLTTGLGYRGRFTIGERTIVRPRELGSRAHKRAFEHVGDYVTSAMTRDVMLGFQDSALTDPKGMWGYHKIPLAIWREVLAFFESQGCIVRRWQLGLPSYGSHLSVPSWGPGGERFEEPKQSWVGGVIPDSVAFDPALLTDEQKSDLIGKPYALHPTDCLEWQKEKEQRYITLDEKNFVLTYFRRRKDISEAARKDGAKFLRAAFGS